MTKTFLLAIGLLFTCTSFAQGFFSLDGNIYNTKDINPAYGVDLSFGGQLKEKNKIVRSIMLGVGVGYYKFNKTNEYIPIYITFGHFNREKKIAPYVNGRIGYGFYEGSARFIGENEYVKGGLYGNIRGGASFKVTKRFFPTPFVGLTLINLRKVIGGKTVARYDQALFNAGVSLLF